MGFIFTSILGSKANVSFSTCVCHVISNKIIIKLKAPCSIKGRKKPFLLLVLQPVNYVTYRDCLCTVFHHFITNSWTFLETLTILVISKCSEGYKWFFSPGFCRHFGESQETVLHIV